MEATGSRFSLQSLHVAAMQGEEKLSHATAFAVEFEGRHYLVTNLHVVTGLNQETGTWLSGCSRNRRPTRLLISWPSFNRTHPDTSVMDLYDDDLKRLYFGGNGMMEGVYPSRDVALIPVPDTLMYQVQERAFRLKPNDHVPLSVTDAVYILGFPDNAALLPGVPAVWTRGSVASEPDLGRDPLLVDARTRPGQSGSPVIVYRRQFSHVSEGGYGESFPEAARLVGVYSGRTSNDSDLGRVWSTETIIEAITHGSHWNH
ncbi:trypsin-like peptidase domain-containing protein [Cellulomonas xiejunii]|uniref:Serine protease n=1 Tax=Cellulomonas xiejunii TaxID=2968083 RepID=A0ABY5KUU3_9CELL|nr:trypsin-like peptidase domain-containing protein [Cellulomonas xiejunii]MCC2315140.1 serine protease [Cellulomonas xiejunii]MCC2321718.1 serine protease [Cellulomonas xiejunii]UUI73027.1 serine protease [Cellulomonas xiejunii]